MARKSRRTRRASRAPRLSPAQLVQPSQGDRPVRPIPVTQATTRTMGDLREEYSYVLRDLKRIGIIAAVMSAAMIVLALLLV